MIDRRNFIRTLAAGGAALACSDRRVHAIERRRVSAPGPASFRSAASQLNATLQASDADVSLSGRSARLFTFNGRLPGPLLEARAGDEVTIRFDNALGEATNLHFHGLHIPPTGTGDNIFLHIEPGTTFTYNFALPPDHAAGLFWYHPHLHGATARQLSRGLAGPFVIRGEIDTVPEVAAANEQIMLLQDFELDSRGNVIEPSVPERMHGREGSIVTAGGAINPTIPIQQNGLLRLRLVNASSSRFYRLQIDEHPLHLIGVDGSALGSARTVDEVLFTPGQRLDILIEGARSQGSYRLLNLPYDRGTEMMGGMMGSRRQIAATETLATIEYRGRAERSWTIPGSLPGTIAPLAPSELPPRTFQLGMGMMGGGMMRMGGGGMNFTINGRAFDANRIDSAPRLGTIEDWIYVNSTTMDHPMHLHTNPFQLVDENGAAERAWRDVILVKAGAEARFRVAFKDFAGKTVQHCHILDHEDQGMMATVEMQS